LADFSWDRRHLACIWGRCRPECRLEACDPREFAIFLTVFGRFFEIGAASHAIAIGFFGKILENFENTS